MLETFKKINQTISRANLLLVCRKIVYDEYKTIIEQYKLSCLVKIVFQFINRLMQELFKDKKLSYNDFTVHVKLFEY
jgi:hypothetical protein